MSTPKFPDWFPGACPPANAVDASGVVYRIVSGATVTEEDFLTHHERGAALSAPACKRCGVSVFSSHEKAVHRLKLSPRLGNGIAKGQLDASSGKTDNPNPNSGHMEWWAYDGVERHRLFDEVTPCL